MPDLHAAPTLLVIDADDAMRALVGEWAREAGHVVRERAQVGAHGGADVNLVVVDLCDLATRGAATVSRVQKLFPAAVVVGLSTRAARPMSRDACATIAPGLAALIPKPCTRAELMGAVAEALRGAHADAVPAPARRAGSPR